MNIYQQFNLLKYSIMSDLNTQLKTNFKKEFKELVNTIRVQKMKNIKTHKTNKKMKHKLKKLTHVQNKLARKLRDFSVDLNKS